MYQAIRSNLFANIYARYLIGGGTAAVVVLGGLFFLHEVVRLDPVVASAIAYAFGIAVSFTVQKFWVFGEMSINAAHRQFAYFSLLAITNLALNSLFMHFLVNVVQVWYLFAQILSAGTIAVWSFAAYRLFIFKSNETTHSNPEG